MAHILEIPPAIIAGWGSVSRLGMEVASIGRNALLLCSFRMQQTERIRNIQKSLQELGVSVFFKAVESGEPTIEVVEQVLLLAEETAVDVVIGIGGGSILDVAKAVAGLKFEGRKPVKDYFYGLQPVGKGIPWVAVPTTSGTGSEATPNSVLSDKPHLKQSIRGDRSWLAQLVLLDPELTVSCSPEVTAWSGMDALTQAIESHTSTGANALTEPYSLKAAQLISSSIENAYLNPRDEKARSDMAYGSLMAGIALANARLGIVHGIAHSIGLHYNVPHGLVCGTLLPWAIEYNTPVCGSKYAELARAMGIGQTSDDLVEWVRGINYKLGIPSSLRSFGLRREDFNRIVEESMPSGSLKANPRETSRQDLTKFLEAQL